MRDSALNVLMREKELGAALTGITEDPRKLCFAAPETSNYYFRSRTLLGTTTNYSRYS